MNFGILTNGFFSAFPRNAGGGGSGSGGLIPYPVPAVEKKKCSIRVLSVEERQCRPKVTVNSILE